MRTWIMAIVVVVLSFMVHASLAQDDPIILNPAQWTGTFGGSDTLVFLGVGYRPPAEKEQRTEIGVRGFYREDVMPDSECSVGLAGYATYDLLYEAPLNLVVATVPTTVYAGVMAGGLRTVESADYRPTAAILLGTSFGDRRVRLGVEASYTVDKDVWDKLADVSNQTAVWVFASYRH
jgi:hypothetical protein